MDEVEQVKAKAVAMARVHLNAIGLTDEQRRSWAMFTLTTAAQRIAQMEARS